MDPIYFYRSVYTSFVHKFALIAVKLYQNIISDKMEEEEEIPASRVYFKRGVQPKCGVQNEKCGVQD